MRRFLGIALFLVSAIGVFHGQQSTPAAPPQTAEAKPESMKVYSPGPDVTAPELLPLNLAINNSEKCKKKVEGVSIIPVIVEATGMPRKLADITSLDTDMDKLARIVVAADQFKPGTHDGQPVAVRTFVEVEMRACTVETRDDASNKTYLLHLKSKPVQKLINFALPPDEAGLTTALNSSHDVGSGHPGLYHVVGGVTPPSPLYDPEPEFSSEAKAAKYQGTCRIGLIVDAQGMPQNLVVVRPLAYGLTEKAIEAVSTYRFKPAMKDGQPVPVYVTIEVNFHLY